MKKLILLNLCVLFYSVDLSGSNIFSNLKLPSVFRTNNIEYTKIAITRSKDYIVTYIDVDNIISNILTTANLNAKDISTQKSEITTNQVDRGITFISNGYSENGSIEIGKDAKASVTTEDIDSAPDNSKLRNVGIAIGTRSEAIGDRPYKNQSVSIGYCAVSEGSNAISIGGGSKHFDDEDNYTGGNAYSKGNAAISLGYSTKALNDGAVSIGRSARSIAVNAIQLGEGINTNNNSLQYRDVIIVKDGKVQSHLNYNELDPRQFDVTNDTDIIAYPHIITSIDPSNFIQLGTEFDVIPATTRNFEIFIPNNEYTRIALPVILDTNLSTNITCIFKNGKFSTKLPVTLKVKQPVNKVVIIESEYLDDGYDNWSPVVTNINIRYNATRNSFVTINRSHSIRGYNLHCVTNIVIEWSNNNSEIQRHVVNVNDTDPFIYGSLYPYFDVPEFDAYEVNINSSFKVSYNTLLGSYTYITNSVPCIEISNGELK